MRVLLELLVLVLIVWALFHFLFSSKQKAKDYQKQEEQKRRYVLDKINKMYESATAIKKDLEYMECQNLPIYLEADNLTNRVSEQIDNVNLYSSEIWLSEKENRKREQIDHDLRYMERQVKELKQRNV